MSEPGALVLVATPLGNLGDLSPRAEEALALADLIACEDTRRCGILLQQTGVDKRELTSLHEHNEERRLPKLIRRLQEGARVALVSDAGTPLISDPGFRLVRAAIESGIQVESVPGPSAPIHALVVSGLPPQPFTFAGFPPPKRGKRQTFFKRFSELGHTLVLFEAPHRLVACLEDALEVLGDRRAVVARELTKLHEEVSRGQLSELLDDFSRRERVRGEITLVIDRSPSDSK